MSACVKCGGRTWLPATRRDGWPVPCPGCATTVHAIARKLDVDVRTVRRALEYKRGSRSIHYVTAERLFRMIVTKAPELLHA